MSKKKKKPKGKGRNKSKPAKKNSTGKSLAQLLLKEVQRLQKEGKTPQALEEIAKTWPEHATNPNHTAKRWLWLLRYWPEQAQQEIQAVEETRLASILPRIVLQLDEARFALFSSSRSTLVQEATTVRVASKYIAEGNDEAAQLELKKISLRSPFRNEKLFLRGLSAWYQQKDQEATKVFTKLQTIDYYANIASSFLAKLSPTETSTPSSALQAKSEAHQILFDDNFVSVCQEIKRHTEQKKPNSILRTVGTHYAKMPPELKALFLYELPIHMMLFSMPPESLIKRLKQTFSQLPLDPRFSRMEAAIYEKATNQPAAISSWKEYFKDLKKGRAKLPNATSPQAEALLNARVGQLYFQWVDEAEKEADMSFSDFFFMSNFYNPREVELNKKKGLQHFEKAVELASDDIKLWYALVNMTEELIGKKERDRVIERMVKQLPGHPTSLLLAAKAASDRGSFDKGMRYAKKAIELEPLNRQTRDLIASMLMGKGFKKYRSGEVDKAIKLYEQAVTVEHTTLQSHLKTATSRIALEEICGHQEKAQSLFQALMDSEKMRWLPIGHFLLARHRLREPGKKRGKKTPRPAKVSVQADAYLDQPPRSDELMALIQLFKDFRSRFNDNPYAYPSSFYDFIEDACRGNTKLLTEKTSLMDALRLVRKSSMVLLLSEQGKALFPRNLSFIYSYYTSALNLEKPVEFFKNAEEELKRFDIDDEMLELFEEFDQDTIMYGSEFLERMLQNAMGDRYKPALLLYRIRLYTRPKKKRTYIRRRRRR